MQIIISKTNNSEETSVLVPFIENSNVSFHMKFPAYTGALTGKDEVCLVIMFLQFHLYSSYVYATLNIFTEICNWLYCKNVDASFLLCFLGSFISITKLVSVILSNEFSQCCLWNIHIMNSLMKILIISLYEPFSIPYFVTE